MIGSKQQIEVAKEVLRLISQSIQDLHKQIGFVEAKIKIPALYLRKVIGLNHSNLY